MATTTDSHTADAADGLRMIPLDAIDVMEGFNPRDDRDAKDFRAARGDGPRVRRHAAGAVVQRQAPEARLAGHQPGRSAVQPNESTTDRDGLPRLVGAATDMGAYEVQ